MSGLRVSIIIPAYKAARTIGRALDSVFAQTRLPEEILVIDDGSPDDLASAVAAYGSQVTLIRKPNGGAASARNLGIESSCADLIAFLDADDYWEPTKLDRQLSIFQRHPELGLIGSRFFTQIPGQAPVPPDDKPDATYDRVKVASGEEAFCLSTKIWTSTVLVRREALGAQRFECGLEVAEDRDLWVRLVSANPVYLIGKPLATAVLEPGSLSRSSVDVAYSDTLRVVRRHAALLGSKGLRSWEGRVFKSWAGGHLANGRPRAAIGPAWRRVSRQPFSPEAWWVLLKSASLACAS